MMIGEEDVLGMKRRLDYEVTIRLFVFSLSVSLSLPFTV